ncbi:MAG: acyl-CoA/acyl-ACP dehydrogenase [Desulfobacteraceae bacterium]|nr:acyl-CoA/acyl-ACP dehydrogenase [Desulfobacteraceae bacterium]
MNHRNIDINISKETAAMLKEVTQFSLQVVRPAGIELDKLPDPEQVIAPGSRLWEVIQGHREMGLHTLYLPKHVGGLADGLDPMATLLLNEQLGYADAGLAISLSVACMPFALAALIPDPELQQLARDFCEDKKGQLIGCWAITEPDHGTDWFLGGANPKCAPGLTAELKGDEYIINGEKSSWVSNGTIATHAVLHVALDPSRGMHGQGVAVLPLNLPGISKGKPLDKMGQRALNQGSIIFQDARVPKKYMVIAHPDLLNEAAKRGTGLATVNGGTAIIMAGLARAAFDEALEYAKKRIQGGTTLFEHAPIKLKLLRMFSQVEAVRAAVRRMNLYNRQNPMAPAVAHAVAAKILATETATDVASDAMQIFGGYGLAREFSIEKMFRDARASMIEDGVNDALAIKAADFL